MRVWTALAGALLMAGSALAQLPPDAVQLDKVKISEAQKSTELDPVTLEAADPSLGTFEYNGIEYGMSKADTKAAFMKDPDKYAEQAAKKRWEYNFTHAMSSIWCPVTDEISPGGNTQWNKIGYNWESCCQFCNDTVTDEDFPRALERLKKRASTSYEMMGGAKYTEGASSPVAGAINLGGPTQVASAAGSAPEAAGGSMECTPEWVEEATFEPTYAGGIAQIMDHRCIECHREGGLAPMALQTLGQVRKWSKNLKTHIENETMPPWPADHKYDYANAKKLTKKEKDVFLAWIDAGYPPGEGTPERREIGDWVIGQPDEVVQLPEYTIAEDVADDVREAKVDSGVDQDRWVVATEVHADSFLVLEVNGGPLGSYHAGNTYWELPEGYGYRLKKGEQVPVRVYYIKEKGWEETDSMTELGVKFAEDPASITKEVLIARMANDGFTIPAGSKGTSASAEFTFPSDGEIVAVNPVMRLRGKSVKVTATFPDGKEQTLVDIPHWENAYHFLYQMCDPIPAPKGTVVKITGTYDNSDMNAANPDPSVDVPAGLNGELLEGWMHYTLTQPTKTAEATGGALAGSAD